MKAPYIVVTATQRDEDWMKARLGRLTSSRVGDAFATIKKGEAASRRNLRTQLVLERVTGRAEETFCSADMQRGTDLEPMAVAAYEEQTGTFVEPVGFLAHPELMVGCSPDGFVGADGVIEVKAPKAATHLSYLQGAIPDDYLKQMQHTLWITGRAWCDFVSFHPDFPEPLRVKVSRVTMTDAERAAHELMVRAFLAEIDHDEANVRALAGMEAVA